MYETIRIKWSETRGVWLYDIGNAKAYLALPKKYKLTETSPTTHIFAALRQTCDVHMCQEPVYVNGVCV